MIIGLPMTKGRMPVRFLAASIFFLLGMNTADAQESEAKQDDKPAAAATTDAEPVDAKKADSDASEPDKEVVEEKDPFAVPADADADELFEFIRSVKRLRGRTLQSAMKAAKAVVAGTEAIRNLKGVDTEDETKAIREQFETLSFLARFDPMSRKQMTALVEDLRNDERPEIAEIAVIEGFKLRIDSARNATAEEQLQMIDELKALLADREFDRVAYNLAYGLARAIGYSDSSEVAASLYEDMSAMMSESKDDSLRDRAPKMMGAARRMRLPGNFMEVMGQTTDGNEFDWDKYRGKVVLVDFWASWCGPCRGEVPNMKRNLGSYGERGFDIVGVNLDKSLEACEKYVEQEELQWVNLISDKEGQRGWDNPLATHYGISAIPTAILVDQDGKVVSLRARGKELDRLLEEMLGKPEPTKVEDSGESEPEPKVAENSS
jgi:thiol-disulfide isomerase/thioredoxin